MLNKSGDDFLWQRESEVLSLLIAMHAIWASVSFNEMKKIRVAFKLDYYILLCYSLYFLLYFFDSKVSLILGLTGELVTAFLNISKMLNE